MARGWESKSIEAQQDEASSRIASTNPRLTPDAADKLRRMQALRLSLRSVLERLEHSQFPAHKAMLEHAKSDLERDLENLENPQRILRESAT
jgi:hypothetical protein